MGYDMKKLEKCARKLLSAKRFYHTQCVVKQALFLSRIYNCDEEKAVVAAWCHDLCKEMSPDEQLQWIEKCGIILDDIQKNQPKTWHGMAACGYMRSELGICDVEILRAVRYHTTACGHMHLLDEVVYLADLTSEERDYPDAARVRKIAETAIAPAMREGVLFSIQDLVSRRLSISRDTLDAYNHYISIC